MTTIEIYEKNTGRVVDTRDIKDLSAFRFYWERQCDTATYAWREKK